MVCSLLFFFLPCIIVLCFVFFLFGFIFGVFRFKCKCVCVCMCFFFARARPPWLTSRTRLLVCVFTHVYNRMAQQLFFLVFPTCTFFRPSNRFMPTYSLVDVAVFIIVWVCSGNLLHTVFSTTGSVSTVLTFPDRTDLRFVCQGTQNYTDISSQSKSFSTEDAIIVKL